MRENYIMTLAKVRLALFFPTKQVSSVNLSAWRKWWTDISGMVNNKIGIFL